MAGSHDLWLRTKVLDTNGMSPLFTLMNRVRRCIDEAYVYELVAHDAAVLSTG